MIKYRNKYLALSESFNRRIYGEKKKTTFLGNSITLLGSKLSVGDIAPEFICLDSDLNPVTLSDFDGQSKIISIVPSIDTGICELQTIRFNKEAISLNNTAVLTIDCDLPFAQAKVLCSKGNLKS